MLRSPRNALWLLPLLLLLGTPLWLPSVNRFLAPRGGYDPRFAEPVKSSPIQNFIMDEVSITLTSKGQEEWQIDARQAYTGAQDNEIELIGVNAMYIGKQRPPTNVESKRGRYLVAARELVLMDNVRISKPTQKEELRTDLLHYYEATKMAVCPGDVEIITQDFHLNAGSMTYDLSTNGYDFGGRVHIRQ